MTSPLHGASRALGLGTILDMTSSALSRAVTKPGTGAYQAPADTTVPTPPPLAPDATSPTAKPKPKGLQSSFLSGVAASGLSASAGSSGGKSLLGS